MKTSFNAQTDSWKVIRAVLEAAPDKFVFRGLQASFHPPRKQELDSPFPV